MGRADGSGTMSSGHGRWVIALVALSAGLIGLIDATVDFIAAPGLWPALWILLVPGLVVVGLLAWRSERLRQAADRFGRVPVVVAVLALMLMLAWFAALLVMMGLPWAYTRAFGSDWQTVQPMRSYHVSDRRTCDYRLAGKLLEHNLRGYLCIDRGTYAQYPPGPVTARLTGQRSGLGMAVEDVHLSAPDQR